MDLASRMGVTDKAVSKWERDLSYPDVNSLPKLAEVFGMTIDDLMQIKTESTLLEDKKPVRETISTVLRAVCLAMGVAVAVLSILNQLDTNTAVMMLGIGVACGGAALLEKSKGRNYNSMSFDNTKDFSDIDHLTLDNWREPGDLLNA